MMMIQTLFAALLVLATCTSTVVAKDHTRRRAAVYNVEEHANAAAPQGNKVRRTEKDESIFNEDEEMLMRFLSAHEGSVGDGGSHKESKGSGGSGGSSSKGSKGSKGKGKGKGGSSSKGSKGGKGKGKGGSGSSSKGSKGKGKGGHGTESVSRSDSCWFNPVCWIFVAQSLPYLLFPHFGW